jgi:hypothetical protein
MEQLPVSSLVYARMVLHRGGLFVRGWGVLWDPLARGFQSGVGVKGQTRGDCRTADGPRLGPDAVICHLWDLRRVHNGSRQSGPPSSGGCRFEHVGAGQQAAIYQRPRLP